MDPTGQDRVAFWLAHGHPAWMLVAIVVAGLALRAGLELRRRRRGAPATGGRSRAELLRVHLRLAKPAVLLMLVGLVAGPVSAVWLRGWSPFGSLHAWLGVLAAGCFVAAAVLGHRLEEGRVRGDARGGAANRHGLLGTLAMLLAAVAAAAGMVLLP